jgi:endonuclease YncB( thermonuclease family)
MQVGAVRISCAHAVAYHLDVKYADIFIEAVKNARCEDRGLWSEKLDKKQLKSTGDIEFMVSGFSYVDLFFKWI